MEPQMEMESEEPDLLQFGENCNCNYQGGERGRAKSGIERERKRRREQRHATGKTTKQRRATTV